MCMSRRVGQWLLGPEDMSSTKKGIITLFCMTSSCLLGFYVQQRIIEKYYGGEQAEIHRRVNEIKRREMQAIARERYELDRSSHQSRIGAYGSTSSGLTRPGYGGFGSWLSLCEAI